MGACAAIASRRAPSPRHWAAGRCGTSRGRVSSLSVAQLHLTGETRRTARSRRPSYVQMACTKVVVLPRCAQKCGITA